MNASTRFGAVATAGEATAVTVGEALSLANGGAVAFADTCSLETVALRLARPSFRHHYSWPHLCHTHIYIIIITIHSHYIYYYYYYIY